MNNSILISEYGKKELNSEQSNSFSRYYEKVKDSKKYCFGSFESRNIYLNSNSLFNQDSNVGIINFENKTFEFRPKLDNSEEENFWKFLPRMMSRLYDLKDFGKNLFIDSEELIDLPKGSNIVPILTLSFVSLCEDILEKGLTKKYILKNERIKSIKGKIDFSVLTRQKPWDLSTVPCSYYDLTFDNEENQIILWCANRLLKQTRILNEKNSENIVLKKLKEQVNLLSGEITLLPKTKKDLLNLNISGVNYHYRDIMSVCKAILSESLFSFNESDNHKNKGINFIINMDWVFEQYMTCLFQEATKDFDNLKINSQQRKSLCDKNKITIKPDLIISTKDDKPVYIIDFKWKLRKDRNADYYQIICYGLAELQKNDNIKVGIFSVGDINEKYNDIEQQFDVISEIFKNSSKEVRITNLILDPKLLKEDNPESEIKRQIKNFLAKCQ